MDSVLDATSPNSGGVTPRRIVKTLRQPLACVTQLVPLDSGDGNRAAHLLHRFPVTSVASEASVSEVRSELCSVAYEEAGDESTSSFFDPRRMRHGNKGSTSMSRSRASRTVTGSRNRPRRSFRSVSSREVEESYLSYSDEPVFYQCDSDASSNSAGTEGSSYSMSYTHISESVPSCSLTVLADPSKSTAGGWASRFRKNANNNHNPNGLNGNSNTNSHYHHPNNNNAGGPSRKGSGSFGSIFGSGGIDPYNGTSLNPHSQQPLGRDSSSVQHAAAARNAAAGHRKAAAAAAAAASSGGSSAAAAVAPGTAPNERLPLSEPALQSPKEFRDTVGPSSGLPVAADDSQEVPSPRDTTALPDTATAAATAAASSEAAQQQRPKVQNVKLLERVGRGTFGDVYRAEDCDTGNIVAVKEIVVPHDFTKDVEKQLAALESEIRVMRRLHHRNVVAYLGANREGNSLRIFMEFVGGGTVGGMLERDGAFSEAKTRKYTAQLLEGLEYLHDSHILHRDLKGDNLFLTEQDELKLGDFGQSKELADSVMTQSVQGTPSFMSPEMIACSGYSFEADVWSVGCCVIQMLTGRPPFSNLDNQMAVMFAIISSKIEDQIPQDVSEGAKDFIRMCTKTNIKDRWSATQLRQHPWLLGALKEAADTAAAATAGSAAAPSTSVPALAATAAAAKAVAPSQKPTSKKPKAVERVTTPPIKPTRSILLDTAALSKTDAADGPRKASGGDAAESCAEDGTTPDNEAGGNTSSNLSSTKAESPAAGRPRGRGAKGDRSSNSASGGMTGEEKSSTPRVSAAAPPSASPSGRRPPRVRNGAKDASPTATAEAAITSDAQNVKQTPPQVALQKPHRPTQGNPLESSPRHRMSVMAGGAGNGDGGMRRQPGSSSPSGGSNNNAARAVNTPVSALGDGGVGSPNARRGQSRAIGSAIQRNTSPGNQTSRATPNAPAARARAPASSRPSSHLPRR